MKNIFLLLMLSFLYLGSSCSEPVKRSGNEILMFYNVENLYDTINDPLKNDEDFLPSASYNWNTEKYNKKISDLAKVITSLGNPLLPAVIGLAEIENKTVLEDLAGNKMLKKGKYKIIWKESPDDRGIDCGFLYNPSVFSPEKTEFISVTIENDEAFKTRDVIYVKGKLKKEDFHIFINHWPSRRTGKNETDFKRNLVAQIVKNKVDSIYKNNNTPNIVIMGDLNDEPSDESISKVLGAVPNNKNIGSEKLVNLMYDEYERGEGSHNNRGDWSVLDNIIVSGYLLEKKEGLKTDRKNGFIFHMPFMEYVNDKGEMSPNRTYGKNYYGGISDHFPVYLILK